MPRYAEWRSRSAYDYIDRLTPAELAWEFLRRNETYREEYFRLSAAGQLDTEAGRAFAARWGLCFPRRPEPPGTRAAGDLVACR
ncbi:transcriptional regulator domain-containing protein [Paracoccus versutus]|uniref:transcriptional regulator domain-containing protein n=1 Tax=Paracoccus versutus TaxID=34007 RepID=UPI003C7CBA43